MLLSNKIKQKYIFLTNSANKTHDELKYLITVKILKRLNPALDLQHHQLSHHNTWDIKEKVHLIEKV